MLVCTSCVVDYSPLGPSLGDIVSLDLEVEADLVVGALLYPADSGVLETELHLSGSHLPLEDLAWGESQVFHQHRRPCCCVLPTGERARGWLRGREFEDGPLEWDLKVRGSAVNLLPGINLATSTEHRVLGAIGLGWQAVTLSKFRLERGLCLLRYQHMEGPVRYELEIQEGTEVSATQQLMMTFAYSCTVSRLMGEFYGRAKTLSSRVRDAAFEDMNNPDVLYVAKLDGVRKWIVATGVAWFVCNPYVPESTETYLTPGVDGLWVLDVEEMHGVWYLIDVLRSEDGTEANLTRSPEDIMEANIRAKGMLLGRLELMVREYHRSYDLALREHARWGDDADGLVAILSGVEQFKLKNTRSVDLMVAKNRFVDGDGKHYRWAPDCSNLRDGSVYECSVSMDGEDLVSRVMRRRDDKPKANTTKTVDKILSVVIAGSAPESELAIRLSTSVRQELYRSLVASGARRIIDVGCSRAECIRCYRSYHGTLLLVEPKEDEVADAVAKHGLTQLPRKEAAQWIGRAPARGIAITCCYFQELCAELPKEAFEASVMCCFSLQFVHRPCSRFQGVWGCMYHYGGVQEGGYAFESSRVCLGPVRGGKSMVKWNGKEFEEPAVTLAQVTGSLPGRELTLPYSGTAAPESVRPLMKRLLVVTPG